MKNNILFLAGIFFFNACKKDDFTPVYVTYAVKAADSSELRISYNSDYYFDSGTRKPVNIISNGGFWAATHLATKQEEYYIKVEYLSSVNPETDFEVKVIFNDTMTVDSVYFDHIEPLVEFSGIVSN